MTEKLIASIISLILGSCVTSCVSSMTLRADFDKTSTKIEPVSVTAPLPNRIDQ